MNAGRMTAKPNYQAGPKIIRYYIVHFVMEGQAVHWVNGRPVTLGKGDMFCVFPYKTARHGLDPDKPLLKMMWFGLTGEGVRSLLQRVGVTEERPYMRKVFHPGVPGIVRQLVDEFRQIHAAGNYFRWMAKMYELFDHLAIADARERQSVPDRSPSSWIRDSERFMNLYFTENITVQDVANYVGVHRSHFSAEFSKRVGIPPVQYLQKLRMARGARMLSDSDFPITDIALSLGYPDLYAFTRAFRNYYGTTPSQYRADTPAEVECLERT
ncbi:AraC family transcriptional regulator [Paenibacillus hemerocallicola]|uniref:AraC family transcriptional regulator n=1 Tax=Paenibacillus hemerocallicola TaxID=1172614 RepID=A0A5C4T186_9BACL|nr:AraC family transcriptional regulator [Paenibacillus hemerocallicola]TNJ62706.1 AraC family transcriptional regulator [Paenibacillus hemerocallicola]